MGRRTNMHAADRGVRGRLVNAGLAGRRPLNSNLMVIIGR
jgi:hypothetical protein